MTCSTLRAWRWRGVTGRKTVKDEIVKARSMRATRRLVALAGLLACVCSWAAASVARVQAQSLPTRLDDRTFWRLSTDLSEVDGVFRSDNLLSNEWRLQYVVPELVRL